MKQIWTLPKLTLVFSTTAFSTLQNVCNDSYEGPTPSTSQDRKSSDTDVESILVAPLGESYHRPHIFVSSGMFIHTSRRNFPTLSSTLL
jgi:cleavage and polyadenylation specificity factor subunit 1